VVACVGAQLTHEQAETLARRRVGRVIIALDPDKAGDSGIESCVRSLGGVGVSAYVAPRLPDGLDPDEFILERGIDAWRTHLAGAVNAYRYQAQTIIAKYRPADGWTDATKDSALRGARDFAAATPPAMRQDVDAHFWPTIREETGVDEAVIRGAAEHQRAQHAVNVAAEVERLEGVLKAGAAALFGDRPLLSALASLSVDDPAHFAALRVSIKDAKVSLRDLDKALKPIITHLRADRAQTNAEHTVPRYVVSGGCICEVTEAESGKVEYVPLCNFAARIEEEVVHDDGAERSRFFAIAGTHKDGHDLPRCEVPVEKFTKMEWPVVEWGACATIYAGRNVKDAVRAAIQLLSDSVETRTVYTHTGWREIGGVWHYLHGGGAIGPDGAVPGVPVVLHSSLSRYVLPEPPIGEQLHTAVRASLNMLDVGPAFITYPLLASAYRAALGAVDYGIHMVGRTGSYKSAVAALAQQHFGAMMDGLNLPANWTSTANAIEMLAFSAKDAILTIDDFNPTGTITAVAQMHQAAERVFRAQGNRGGRLRLNCNAELREGKPPRGLILSTGEDTPRGESLRARFLALDVAPGDLGPKPPAPGQPPPPNPKLTACQKAADAGLYAQAMSGFVRWLAPRYAEVRARLKDEHAELRSRATTAAHARTPSMVADITLGLRYMLRYAMEVGAVTKEEHDEHADLGTRGIADAASRQRAALHDANPVDKFLALLASAIASGRAHIADRQGGEPGRARTWGWAERTMGVGNNQRTEWIPGGRCVGWLAGTDLFLEPEAAYAEVQRLAGEQGESFTVTSRALFKRLDERGLLVTKDVERERLTVRKQVQGATRPVLHLRVESVLEAEKIAGFRAEIDFDPDAA
jgi:hypothetical protein